MTTLGKLPLGNGGGLMRVVVETPKGSRQKIHYDATHDFFFVKRRLPLGSAYPFHFGFFPSTCGGDGDPLDAIVLDDGEAYPGLVLNCRVVAVLRLSQREDGKKFRNDRFIAVPDSDLAHAHIRNVRDIAKNVRSEIEEFLAASVRLEDKKLSFLGWSDARAAAKLIAAGRLLSDSSGS